MISAAPTHARIDTGAAVGIGLGSFALGTAVGAAANPYYNPYYYPNGYAHPPPAYYPPPLPGAAELLGPILPALLRLLIYNGSTSIS